MSVSSRQPSPSKVEAANKEAELQRMRDVCQKLALEKNALFVKHQTALDDQNALKALHAQKMEMMLASLNNLLKSTGNIKVERVEDLILQEKALTEAILLKQGTSVFTSRSRESSNERSVPRSPRSPSNTHPLSDDEKDSSSTEGGQHAAFATPTDVNLPLCPSGPFLPSLSAAEGELSEPSISSHVIPVHAYVSAPDVQPTYEEILAEIKARKTSGSRSRNDTNTTQSSTQNSNLKQRRNKIKRRTATPASAVDNEDEPDEAASTSTARDSRKPSTSAPMEFPEIQPFALRTVPPTTPTNPDGTQKDPWYKKGWFSRRTASDPPTSQAKIAENSELHFNRYYRIGELNGTKVMMRIRPTFASNRMDFGFKIKIIDEDSPAPSQSPQQNA